AHRLGITVTGRNHVVKPTRDAHDIGQFHRAFHLRVARENLFHKGGPGAWQAHYEDRSSARSSRAGMVFEERLIEERTNACRASFELLNVEWLIQPPHLVAPCIVAKRFLVQSALLKSLAERKRQVSRIAPVNLVARQQLLHG